MRSRPFGGLVLPFKDARSRTVGRSFGILFVLLASSFCALANPCGSFGNTLEDYINAGTCMDLTGAALSNFSFGAVPPSGGGAIPISAANITVLLFPQLTSAGTANGAGVTDGVEFVFNNQGVSGTGFVTYQIGFAFDDPSGDLRDILDPGMVNINTGLCLGSAFVAGSCPGGDQLTSATVSGGAPTETIFGSASSTTWGIENTISLNANGGTASFYGIENDVVPLASTPEPAGSLLTLCGLGMIALRCLRTPGTAQKR